MLLLSLAARSLRNRMVISVLTVASIALSVTLLVGVENVRAGVRDSFAGTIKGTDLIVGARGGTQQVLLSTVFGMATPAGAVSWATFERWQAHPAVAWAIPYSLGDSHRGFRVVGTTPEFFTTYRFRDRSVTFAQGRAPTADDEVAIGAEVAARLGYAVDQRVVVAHGQGGVTFEEHGAHPFRVVGVIARTFTPIDRALYVTLEGIEAMHEEGGTAPVAGTTLVMPGSTGPAAGTTPGATPGMITAFFVGTKNRIETLSLQREMNDDRREPLTAIVPGVALAELWQSIASAEVGLKVVAAFTVLVGLIGMCVALYASLESRRREMAILRAVGAGPRTIVALLVLESGLLAVLGAAVGVALVYAGIAVAQGPVEARFGLSLTFRALGGTEWRYLALIVSAGVLVGVLPAWKAYRTSLSDGLSPKL
jgi:putative ABC transport system permease protein